jgi:hypothetical protein
MIYFLQWIKLSIFIMILHTVKFIQTIFPEMSSKISICLLRIIPMPASGSTQNLTAYPAASPRNSRAAVRTLNFYASFDEMKFLNGDQDEEDTKGKSIWAAVALQ